MRVLDRVLGAGAGRQAPETHQRRVASGVSAPVRALPGAWLARMATLAGGDPGTGAALGGDLYQRCDREHRGEPQRVARRRPDRAAAAAAAAAARLGEQYGESGGGVQGRPPGIRVRGTSMDFALTEEQQLIVRSTREFVRRELVPHEQEVEESGSLREELRQELKAKAIAAGLYAANMPTEVGGAGLDAVSWVLYEKELGHTGYALHYACVARPSNILLACQGAQRERYLLPAVRGERTECLAMSEPQAGSDLRGMKTTALPQGGDFIVNGTKHFISHADHADFVILFAATGEETSARGKRKLISAFLVDTGTPGFEVRPGYQNVSHRGYTNSILQFTDCRLPNSALLGELHRGFELANTWLGATRLQVAANCLGRAG